MTASKMKQVRAEVKNQVIETTIFFSVALPTSYLVAALAYALAHLN